MASARKGKLRSAIGSVVESLEKRQLLASVAVNFQTSGTSTPSGYLADSGATYANRGNGYSYGWNTDNSANTANEGAIVMIDTPYKTYAKMQPGGVNRTWEIGLTNGQYQVKVVAGDYENSTSDYDIRVEGTQGPMGNADAYTHWFEKTVVVNVTDGRLTLTNGSGASDQRISFVQINDVASLSAPTTAVTNLTARAASNTAVDLLWDDTTSNEYGFEIQRKLGAGSYSTIATVGGGNEYWGISSRAFYTDTGVTGGQSYAYRVRPVNAAGAASNWSNEASVSVPSTNAQAAYNNGTPRSVTSRIEAEDFDFGGSGYGYADASTGNYADLYRKTDVDVGMTSAGYFVGWNNAGEWTAYTVTVPTTGTYDLTFSRSRTGNGGTFEIYQDATRVGPASIQILDSGGTFTFATTTVSGFNLTAGTHVLKLKILTTPSGSGECGNIDWLQFNLVSAGVAAPTGLAAPTVQPNSVSLTWTDNASDETSYRVERKVGTGAWSTLASGLDANSAGYTDSTVSANTSYTYRVVAVGATDSPASNEVSVTTPTNSVQHTLAPTADAYVRGGSTYENQNYGSTTEILAKLNSVGSSYHREIFLKFDISGLTDVSSAKLRLYGRRQSLVGTDPNPINFDIRSVSDTSWTESGLTYNNRPSTISTLGTVGLTLTTHQWFEVDITSFVQAERTLGHNLISLGIVGTFSGSDAAFYINTKETTNGPELVALTPTPADPPAAPTDLTVTAATATSISLAWTDNATTETSYRVEYRVTGATSYTTISPDLPANTTNYTVTGLLENTQYDFRVRAANSGGDSSPTGLVQAWTTVAVPGAPTNATFAPASAAEVLITWTAGSGDPEEYYVYASLDNGPFELHDIVAATNTSYRFFLLESATASFKLSAVNAGGESSLTNVLGSGGVTSVAVTGSTPTVPTGMTLSAAAYTDSVPLSWTAAPDATGYVIEWSNGDGEWFAIDETTDTTYVDEYPTLGSQQYRIVTYRGNLDPQYSAPSAAFDVHPIAPPVAWYDDNAGANERGTLSPYHTKHGEPLTFSVVPNDIDYDSSNIVIPTNAYTQPQEGHGSVSLNVATGEFTYTPPDDTFVGTATFTYWVNDGSANSAPATVAIDVTNTTPVAHQETHNYHSHFDWVQEGTLRVDQLAGTLAATDEDGDGLTYTIIEDPQFGTAEVDPSTGNFVYTPDASFNGIDKFTFVVSDGISVSPPAAATVLALNDSALSRVWSGTFLFPLWGLGYGVMVLPSNGSPGSWTAEIIEQPSSGTLTFAPYGELDEGALIYQPNGQVSRDSAVIKFKSGAFETLPLTIHLINIPIPEALYYYEPAAAPANSMSITSWQGATDLTNPVYSLISNTSHGNVTLTAGGSFTYTPPWVLEGSDPDTEPFIGWTTCRYRVTGADGHYMEYDVQLNVGADVPPPAPTVRPLPLLQSEANVTAINPTFEAITQGITDAKKLLRSILDNFSLLGNKVKTVDTADDDAFYNEFETNFSTVDALAGDYDRYINILSALNYAGGGFLADQWYVSAADEQLIRDINKLPFSVGSLRASEQQMEKLANSLSALGTGAGIAVDTASTIVTYAENTRRVLDAVTLATGVGGVLKTGVQILAKEGFKQLAKQAAKGFVTKVGEGAASQTANVIAGYMLNILGVSKDNEYLAALKTGVEAYQCFSLLKKLRPKCTNGACFVAGTGVLSGVDVNGNTYTKIEDIRVGDYVLSRDQHDASDDLDLRKVTNVFVRTSDHIRVVAVAGDGGNIETLRTTDEHPFFVQGKGWIGAGAVRPGDQLQAPDGSWQEVLDSDREAHPGGITVYNFEVEGDHTYFVEDGSGAADLVWVHNAGVCGGPDERFGKAADAIGDLNGAAVFIKRASTKNAQWRDWGYTETHYYRDSNGAKWTVFFNPRSGEYSGAHPSSSQNT